jgi:glycosyltransferase involved in cell wall biosynthesis
VGRATPQGLGPLRGLDNVHVYDPVPFETAPEVVRACDVGIIPYRVGGLIDYVHPKKCFEYLAAGLPVVATGLPALRGLRPWVRVGDGPDGFTTAVGRALRCAGCAAAVWFGGQLAAANSWDARGRQLLAELEALGGPR